MTLPSNVQDLDPYLRLPAVLTATGLSERSIYRLVNEDKFPSPKKLGANAVGWRASAVKAWCDTRPDARPQAA